MDWGNIIAALIGGGIAGIIAAAANALKLRSDAGNEFSDRLMKRIDQLTDRLCDLEKKSEVQDSVIDELQLNNLELTNKVNRLTTENTQLKAQVTAIPILEQKIKLLEAENSELRTENQDLRDRLEIVEKRNPKTQPIKKLEG